MGNLAFNKVEYCGELKVKHENSKNMHGYYSLLSNTTGSNNTATGYYSLLSNTTGSRNAGTGYYSLRANTTGYNNTAIRKLLCKIGLHKWCSWDSHCERCGKYSKRQYDKVKEKTND